MPRGPTPDADLPAVRLVRGSQVIALDLTRPDLATARTTIRSGDEIVVGRSRSVLRDVVAPWAALIGGLLYIVATIREAGKTALVPTPGEV